MTLLAAPVKETLTSSQRKLRYLYLANASLCIFMVVWILILPSSAWQGYNSWLDHFRETQIVANAAHVPPALFEKFKGQTAVHLTHTLPGALWAGIIPYQLHPGLRKQNRRLHRALGYVFVIICALMLVGICIIFQRDLLFEHFLDEVPKKDMIAEMFLIGMSIWFGVTIAMATIEARRKRFAVHQGWILRHIASGMWIAVQRVIIILTASFFKPPFFEGPVPQWVQGKVFTGSAQIAAVITITTSEYAIHLLRVNSTKKLN